MKTEMKQIYDAGFDAGRNGSNATNTHFSYFSTKEKMEEWSRGKADGEKYESNLHPIFADALKPFGIK